MAKEEKKFEINANCNDYISLSGITMLLRLPEVLKITGLGKTKLYCMVKKCDFPAPVQLGARAVAWRSDQVIESVNARPVVVWVDAKPD